MSIHYVYTVIIDKRDPSYTKYETLCKRVIGTLAYPDDVWSFIANTVNCRECMNHEKFPMILLKELND